LPPDGERWRDLLTELVARGVPTSVDINMRPMVARDKTAYAALAHRVLAQARYIKVSDEDLRAMGHTVTGAEDARRLASALLSPTTQVVVLTLGREGAWCLTAQQAFFQPAPQVTVVDAVGAGDCFYAGFLSHLDEAGALGLPTAPGEAALRDAMAFGQRVTAFNLQRSGCQPPWRDEV
jgi:fructokinase